MNYDMSRSSTRLSDLHHLLHDRCYHSVHIDLRSFEEEQICDFVGWLAMLDISAFKNVAVRPHIGGMNDLFPVLRGIAPQCPLCIRLYLSMSDGEYD